MCKSQRQIRTASRLLAKTCQLRHLAFTSILAVCAVLAEETAGSAAKRRLGMEIAVPHHLVDDEEFRVSLDKLLAHGKLLFNANWTDQEGAGRPLMKGTTRVLSDTSEPLTGMRAFNRISGPDANSCAGCHNAPYGISGGGGDFVTNVFVQAQRFDFVTFDATNRKPTKSSVDEKGRPVNLLNAANLRATTGMFGAGYLEMLAREMTSELQSVRDSIRPGETRALAAKGIRFGLLTRRMDGMWDTTKIEGLPRQSIEAPTPVDVPSLIIRPWHQSGTVVSLREFSNNAFHQHHGIQSTERFGRDTDPDGDGFMNEMTRADVTAVSVYQAVLPVPGRVIPHDKDIERAVWRGEQAFETVGCARCHIPELPLSRQSWAFSEPSPYNPPANLRAGETEIVSVDLTDRSLPLPRLAPASAHDEVLYVPAYTDFKLHDITDASAPEAEPLDMNHTIWSESFGKGNRMFLTKRLWGCANEPPYFHHGLFTTLRQSILAHSGEAKSERERFQSLTEDDQDAIIEFLKTLQVLPQGTGHLIVDEGYKSRPWPPANLQ